MHNTYFGLWS